MSQVIIKNLPEKVNDEQVRNHFAEIGTITDLNLKYKNGKFRRFAFIGFESPNDAQEAKTKFNDTYFGKFKLQVDVCGSKVDFKKEEEKVENCVENLDASARRILEENDSTSKKSEDTTKNLPKNPKNWKELFTVVVRTKEQNTDKEKKGRTFTKKSIKMFLKPLKYKSLRIPRDISYVAYIGFETEKQMSQFLLKDKSFLDNVRVRIHKYEKREFGNKQLGDAPWRAAAEKLLTTAEPIESTGKLYIRNLYYNITEDDLKEFFEKIGPLADISLPICKSSRKIKGFAHLTYVFPEHAVKAFKELDGTIFHGRILHILPSNKKEDEDDDLTFKEKKKNKLKNSWLNWNSLFLGSGAVVDLLSEKLGRSKQEILRNEDSRNKSAAATLALGEAQIVEENRKFLENEGVSLESFSNPGMQRSSTVILAKNLAAHTTAMELVQLFSRHGELGRVVLPPSGVTGIVEFLNPTEAKIAFTDLAYTRFKNLPLYLEWAPMQTFKTEHAKKEKILDSISPNTVLATTTVQSANCGNPEINTTLYVKNLNFKTTEETLKSHFSKIGPVYSVRIALKRCLSQGYGFVQYFKTRDAQKALNSLQSSNLDEHSLSLKFSEKSLVPEGQQILEPSTGGSKKLVPVIIVKNIPFESPISEVKEVFKTFGEISSIRLPRHIESEQHRGFCFVDFLHLESALNAFATLSPSTHLRGRRLVLEWAKDNESVEDLRKRTADRYLEQGQSKRRRKVEISDKKTLDEG